MQVQKTVFISYRRTNSFHALAIYQALTARSYNVFFDYLSIDSGAFDQIIIGQIDSRAHFLILLTPSALERCTDPNDWLRREIERAIEMKRNIIPLRFEGFEYPEVEQALTGKLAVLPQYNWLPIPSELMYFEPAMEILCSRFLNRSLDTVLHPAPPQDVEEVAQQQAAADAAPKPTEEQLTAEQHFERATAYYKHNDYDEAIRELNEAIRLNPQNADAYNNRGVALYNQQDYAGAIRDYDVAIRLNPQATDAYINRGFARAGLQDYAGAIRDCDEAIRLNPQDADAYNNRGLARAGLQDYIGAIRDWDEAIRLNPQFAEAYNNRGLARAGLQDYAGAIRDYDEAIRLNPQFAGAYRNRGVARYTQKDYDEAIRDYDETIRLDPHNSVNYGNRGEAHFALKQYEQALDDFRQSNSLEPGYNFALAGLAITQHALGNVREARRLWRILIGMDARYGNADWVKNKLNWAAPLVEEARKLIAGL